MKKEEFEIQREKNLAVAGEIIEILIREEMNLDNAKRTLGYVENRIEDQIKGYRDRAKIDEKYKKNLDYYEIPRL